MKSSPHFTRLKDCVVTNKNVLVRVDINVPIIDGKIQDDTRIRAVLPTLQYLASHNAKIIVISHFARPEGKREPAMSLSQLVAHIQKLLPEVKVNFVDDCIGDKVKKAVTATAYGEIIILENLRFYKAETKNDEAFAREIAGLANLYVNDAFSCSHRAHASIVGIPAILKSCAGFLMESELDALNNLLANPEKPMMAVVGGAKVSTKIDLLNSLVTKAQTVVIAGGMANTFLYASGTNIGKSLCEKDFKETALKVLADAKANNCEIILPTDVVVTTQIKANAVHRETEIAEIKDDEMIVDLGPNTVAKLKKALSSHKTLVWNGPLGVFECPPFDKATKAFALEAAKLTQKKNLISVAGGGDVVSALNATGTAADFTYISTAGGAFLEWLEGKDLPGVSILIKNNF